MKVRYIVLAFLVSLGLITFLDRICFSVASSRIMAELKLDPGQFGWAHSVFILGYGLFQVPLGALADRYGQRVVVALIVVWWSIFTVLTGFAGGLVSLLAIRFLFGLGEAGAYPAITGVVSHWFPKTERGLAQGFVWGASRLGGALSPLIVVPVQQAYGWRVAFLGLGAIGSGWVIGWWLWFRNRPEDQEWVTPAELAEINAGKTTAAKTTVPWGRIFAALQMWIIVFMYFFYVFGSWFYFTWLPTYLEKGRHFSENEMKVFYTLPFLLAVLSNVGGGMLSDALSKRYGRRVGRVAIGSGSLALAAVCLALTATLPGAHKLGIGICVTLGLGIMDCMLPCAWAICLDVGEKYAGTVSGAMNSAGCLGGFLCAALFGWVVKETGNYNLPVLGIAVMVAISALLFACINPNRRLVPNENDPSPGFNDH
jgi:sugar phosphate permease